MGSKFYCSSSGRARQIILSTAATLAVVGTLGVVPGSRASTETRTVPVLDYCGVKIVGVTPDLRMTQLIAQSTEIQDSTVAYEPDPSVPGSSAPGPLSFTPAQMVDTVGEATEGKPRKFLATSADRTLRLINVAAYSGKVTVEEDHGANIAPIAMTASPMSSYPVVIPVPHLYTVTPSGNLWRYRISLDNRDLDFSDNPIRLRSGFENIQTLTWYRRITVNRRQADVLFVTTRFGGLYQVTVPVASPRHASVTRLARSGFASYDALTAGACGRAGRNDSDHGVLAVDRESNIARWYILPSVRHPKSAPLYRGRTIRGADWNLRPLISSVS